MQTTDTYISDATYRQLVRALTTLTPCPVSGQIEEYQIVEVVGEIGGVWPASVLKDSLRDSGPAADGETLPAAA